jgi:hypothetical protein
MVAMPIKNRTMSPVVERFMDHVRDFAQALGGDNTQWFLSR